MHGDDKDDGYDNDDEGNKTGEGKSPLTGPRGKKSANPTASETEASVCPEINGTLLCYLTWVVVVVTVVVEVAAAVVTALVVVVVVVIAEVVVVVVVVVT
ncbi:hypothetical protein ElyMa_004140700 [Elysia marginata]|uniref:Uncharacterized protein n=1 Tax=Elysia marginata TaxID=1093978 RepID=A0AAV4GG47_9GAST|nr:hypothetical protein ElyMa_004140700 [Elysia marginata]